MINHSHENEAHRQELIKAYNLGVVAGKFATDFEVGQSKNPYKDGPTWKLVIHHWNDGFVDGWCMRDTETIDER